MWHPGAVADFSQAIVRDIVAGRTQPEHFAQHRDPACHATPQEFVAALMGNYRR
jgi:hypothetical protein